VPISDLLRKHGMSRPTYFNWRAEYGDISASELKRMKDAPSGGIVFVWASTPCEMKRQSEFPLAMFSPSMTISNA